MNNEIVNVDFMRIAIWALLISSISNCPEENKDTCKYLSTPAMVIINMYYILTTVLSMSEGHLWNNYNYTCFVLIACVIIEPVIMFLLIREIIDMSNDNYLYHVYYYPVSVLMWPCYLQVWYYFYCIGNRKRETSIQENLIHEDSVEGQLLV